MMEFLTSFIITGASILLALVILYIFLVIIASLIGTIWGCIDMALMLKNKDNDFEPRTLKGGLKQSDMETKKTVVTEIKNNCGNSNDDYCKC